MSGTALIIGLVSLGITITFGCFCIAAGSGGGF
jgi:hypothetical protein